MTSTTVASDAHDHWSSADKISVQIENIRDFARVLTMASADLDSEEGSALGTVAWQLVQMCEQAKEAIEELQHKLSLAADIADEDDEVGEAEEAAS